MRGPVRRTAIAAGVAAALALAAATESIPAAHAATTPVTRAVLTRDGSDSFVITGAPPAVAVSARTTNAGGNTRMVFWPAGAPDVTDGESCATWRAQQGEKVQPGAAFNVTQNANGIVRALTVTRNVYTEDPNDSGQWVFNVHKWDTSRQQEWALLKNISVPALRRGRGVAPLPWHFCASVKGRRLRFKVWLDGQPEPAYGAPGSGGTSVVPKAWKTAGKTGWYIGHLRPGDRATFTDLMTR